MGIDLAFVDWYVRAAGLSELLTVELGDLRGQRVLIWMSNDDAPMFVTTFLGVLSAGGIVVPLDDRLSPVDAQAIIAETQPQGVVFSRRVALNLGPDGLSKLGLSDWEPDDDPEIGYVARVTGATIASSPLSWRAAEVTSESLPDQARPDDTAFIAYTSGSTGAPKGAMMAHGATVQYCERTVNYLFTVPRGLAAPPEGDVVQSPIALYTAVSAMVNLFPSMFAGSALVYEGRRFDPATSEQLMAQMGTTIYYGAPAHYAMICALEAPKQGSAPSLDLLITGGSSFSAALYERMKARWPGVHIANGYGLNESGPGQTLNFGDDLERDPAAVGRPVWPTELKIVDQEGRRVKVGAEGELWLRAPGQMREYFRNPEQTAARVREGWIATGDRATLGSDGLVRIVGRTEDRINRGGFKFYPIEIESVLLQHDAVREAAAVGVPHEILGQQAVAFVVLNDGAQEDEKSLRDFCRERMARNKVPSAVFFLEGLARNNSAKVVRRELVSRYQALVGPGREEDDRLTTSSS